MRKFLGMCLVYPAVGAFYAIILLDDLTYFVKSVYYKMFGIRFMTQNGKFSKIAIRY